MGTFILCPLCQGDGCEFCKGKGVTIPACSQRTFGYSDVIYSGTLVSFPSRNEYGQLAWMFSMKKNESSMMVPIKPDDYIAVYAADGCVLFEGIITLDTETGWKPYPGESLKREGEQRACGLSIPWCPQGIHPDVWTSFFLQKSPLRAVLVKGSDEGYL